MKEKKKINYLGSFGKMAVYSTILLIIIILLYTVFGANSPIFYILFLSLVVVGIAFVVSLYGFIILTIINQFKDNLVFWAIVNSLLLIIHLADAYGNVGTIVGLILIISCLGYYLFYARPKFKKKD